MIIHIPLIRAVVSAVERPVPLGPCDGALVAVIRQGLLGLSAVFCAALLSLPAAADVDQARQSFSFDNDDGLSGTAVHQLYSSRHGVLASHNGAPLSQFFIRRDYQAAALHYGSTVSGNEGHHYGGVSMGAATLAIIQGEAESFSKAPNTLYSDLNQHFFHGGSRSRFEFQGAAANIGIRRDFSARLAATRVAAAGVRDRDGYYLGLGSRHFEAGVFQVERGHEKVGQGLDLSLNTRRLDIGYQALKSEYGAGVQRLALEWRPRPRRSFSLELEQAENTLFPGDDEQRVMFRFRTRFGGSPAFNAAQDDGDGEEQKGGFGKAVAIGVGVGVAALALSSGDSDKDAARRFSVRHNAAREVLNDINPVSVRQNREHGGWIYLNADNTFGYTRPVAGTVASVNLGDPEQSVPNGTRASASYHTHGGPDPRFDNENFSPQDLLADRIVGVDGYLGTPAGFMKFHNHRTDSIQVLGRINN